MEGSSSSSSSSSLRIFPRLTLLQTSSSAQHMHSSEQLRFCDLHEQWDWHLFFLHPHFIRCITALGAGVPLLGLTPVALPQLSIRTHLLVVDAALEHCPGTTPWPGNGRVRSLPSKLLMWVATSVILTASLRKASISDPQHLLWQYQAHKVGTQMPQGFFQLQVSACLRLPVQEMQIPPQQNIYLVPANT